MSKIEKINLNDITSDNYNGNNIWYGVREHSMGAISNGLALSNIRPYCSTFLSFSDYITPAMRMSSLMNLPVTYIFSHDSINIGQDGPTHQPVEQLAMIRSIPNMKLFRPADVKELQGCWNVILNSNNNPSTLILSRTEVCVHDNTSIIGSVRAQERNGTVYIGKLMVHPDHRHKGFGTMLLSEIEKYFSVKRYELFTSTRSLDNIRLYQKLGYKIFAHKSINEELEFVYMEKLK